MKIYEDRSSTYADAIDHYWDLSEFCTGDKEKAFFAGWAYMDKYSAHKEEIAKYKFSSFYNTEHPCVFTTKDENMISLSSDSNKIFDKIFTLCPYTAEWLNKKEKDNRFEYIFFPFNSKHIVDQREEKQFDALYWGGIHGFDHIDILNAISKFKYNFLTVGALSWQLWKHSEYPRHIWENRNYPSQIKQVDYEKLITAINYPRQIMWKLLRRTKVNVISNKLYMNKESYENITLHSGWEDNKCFSHISDYIMPQIKTRPIESAINRSLMVVKRDPWNVQEDFFEPEKEFIYYEDEKDLQSILEDVKINWKNYEQIVENAFNKAVNNYTTKHFIEEVQKKFI